MLLICSQWLLNVFYQAEITSQNIIHLKFSWSETDFNTNSGRKKKRSQKM